MLIATRRGITPRVIAAELGVEHFNPIARPELLKGTVVNWGCTFACPPEVNVLNRPEAVARASDKRVTFLSLSAEGVRTVPYTVHPDEAYEWYKSGRTVYGRALTRGSQGRGIVLFRPEEEHYKPEFRPIRLFTRFVKPDLEARVHVFRGRVLDYVVKRRRRLADPPPNRYWIRNHRNGWVFAREDAVIPDSAKDAALEAIEALGLDFGSVDVIVRGPRAYVLEVNTAPGLEGTALAKFVEALKEVRDEFQG